MTKDLTPRKVYYIDNMYPKSMYADDRGSYITNVTVKQWRRTMIPFDFSKGGYQIVPDSLCVLFGIPLAVDKT
jgi:hypothetical protein